MSKLVLSLTHVVTRRGTHANSTNAHTYTRTSYAHYGRQREKRRGKEGSDGSGWGMEKSRLCSSQSGPEHVGHVSVAAVDPEDQGEGNGHKGPGDSLHTCRQGAAFGVGRLLQVFTGLQVVPGSKLEQFVQ